jgi:hypothetical protein
MDPKIGIFEDYFPFIGVATERGLTVHIDSASGVSGRCCTDSYYDTVCWNSSQGMGIWGILGLM